MKKCMLTSLLIILFATLAMGQSARKEQEEPYRRHFLESSLFMLLNLAPDPGDFYQLEYGYFLSRKDAILIGATTWKYHAPLGNTHAESYPGYIRAFGLSAGYQRFLWKNLYTTGEATAFLQRFHENNNPEIRMGFQLYLQVILGYRIEFLHNRLFVEPAVAIKYWPIDTHFPTSFTAIEKGQPNYSCEPGLNVGFRF